MEIFVDVKFVPARTGKTPPVRVDTNYDLKTAQVCFFLDIIVPFCLKITAEHRHSWLTINYTIVNSSEEVLEMSDKQVNSFSSDGG